MKGVNGNDRSFSAPPSDYAFFLHASKRLGSYHGDEVIDSQYPLIGIPFDHDTCREHDLISCG